MQAQNLPAPFDTELTTTHIEIVSNPDIQYLFNKPATIIVAGHANLSSYQVHLDDLFHTFAATLKTNLETQTNHTARLSLLEEARFALNEFLHEFKFESADKIGATLTFSHRIELPPGYQIPELYVRAVISEFLELQRRMLEKAVRFIDLQMRLVRAQDDAQRNVQNTGMIQTLNGIVQMMVAERQPAATDPTTRKITWDGSAHEFVMHFHNLIESRTLYLDHKHKQDTDPIVSLLHAAFRITKAKGDGEISEGTLKTYFKKYRADGRF
ncbi:MAG: hypothetical protein AAF570_05340 [Bacteroidota bacterium]